ncbi:lyase family protein [Mangrovibrevibacter kandeliae]|uniref:lyase family protein n=1 Tax=Mangrovibrevibacter kandeliae TaxID=2968473 RepID=UPI002119A052|nr:lyase family protein [Aurantimonas sp. CSK15Z-1]MCQ8782397.1 lyase family protein [Aurantimonas sp. CSK15Z-1]
MTDPNEQPAASAAASLTLAEVTALFSRRALWSSWLEVEAALAETQAELGIVPAAAAAEICANAELDILGEAALAADIERTRAPVVSLVRLLAAACAGDAGGYVHWGATTQNVMQTGLALQMQRAHAGLMARFDAVLRQLASLAETHAETLTVARTNLRHALPITFGFKAAGWIEEWLRHRDRFAEAAPRVFRAQWGGAVGAMHAVGAAGPELNRRLAARLSLGHYTVPSRAALDCTAEYALLLALVSGTVSKIARDLYTMMADEFGEAAEALDADVVGSSTMPHKVNPKSVVRVLALAARVRAQVPLALEAMQPGFEGDGANNLMIGALAGEACPLGFELLDRFAALLDELDLDPARMAANVAINGPLLASENLMMALAPTIGRTRAHDLVHHAVAEAVADGRPLANTILASPDVAGVPAATIHASLDPAGYVGLSAGLAREMAGRAFGVLAGGTVD